MSYVNAVTIDTDGSATDTLVTAAFVTSGSSRHIDVHVNIATSSATTVSSVSRSTETYAEQRADVNPTGSTLARGAFWMSTTEPTTGSNAMTIVISTSRQYWGASVLILDDVNQTTRIRGGTVSLNPDGDSTVADLVISSATGDLVVSSIAGGIATVPTAPTGGTETLRASWNTGADNGWGLIATAPGAASVTLGWDQTTWRFVHYAASHPVGSTAPSATVPGDGICINIYGETAVTGISVTEGTSSIVSVATTSTAGSTLTYDTTGTSVTISGNGTNAATLSNGASEAEYNTVLGTLTMRGTTVDTTITVTVIPTDGTLNDNETFDVFCDPNSLTCTGSNADVIAWAASLQVRILVGQTNDTISVHIEDDTGTPIEVDSSFVAALASYFQTGDGDLPLLASTRGITDVIM